MKRPAGYRVSFGGLLPRLEHAAGLTALAAALALLLVVGILLLQFERLGTVGILLLQVPLTLTGGMLALGLGGVGLNATGVVGFLTLVGIGLDHDIVLLHRAGRNEAAGMDPASAIRDAVAVRFRPIVLTTLTAVLGMLPTALGWGAGAAPEQGMALVILGGVVWSSVLSTNLIPALWLRSRVREASAGAVRGCPWHKKALPPKREGHGGGDRDRTDDLRVANATLSQLSYAPRAAADGRATGPGGQAVVDPGAGGRPGL